MSNINLITMAPLFSPRMSVDWQAGDLLDDQYTVVSLISDVGAFSTVWLARRCVGTSSGELVALKAQDAAYWDAAQEEIQVLRILDDATPVQGSGPQPTQAGARLQTHVVRLIDSFAVSIADAEEGQQGGGGQVQEGACAGAGAKVDESLGSG